jgi:hypothetical protein
VINLKENGQKAKKKYLNKYQFNAKNKTVRNKNKEREMNLKNLLKLNKK